MPVLDFYSITIDSLAIDYSVASFKKEISDSRERDQDEGTRSDEDEDVLSLVWIWIKIRKCGLKFKSKQCNKFFVKLFIDDSIKRIVLL